MKKVLVTGGMGYIGSHTVVELIESGYDVVIADNLCNSSERVLDAIEKITGVKPIFEKIDLTDEASCLRLFLQHSDIEAVIHFAALKSVNESIKIPNVYYRNNINSLLSVLDGMKMINCDKIIFSSSCCVYGRPVSLPVSEEHGYGVLDNAYSRSKRICEEILKDAAKADGNLSVLCLRYFNPIGAHVSGLIGEMPNGEPSNLMPYITQTAIGIRPCLMIFGNDYDTPDGTAIRDFIHVSDVAEAHVCAMKYILSNDVRWDAVNIGCGRPYSVYEVVNSFLKSFSAGVKKIPIEVVGRREGDIEKIWGNVEKAKRVLGWEAKRGLDEMTLSAWRWQQSLKEQ